MATMLATSGTSSTFNILTYKSWVAEELAFYRILSIVWANFIVVFSLLGRFSLIYTHTSTSYTFAKTFSDARSVQRTRANERSRAHTHTHTWNVIFADFKWSGKCLCGCLIFNHEHSIISTHSNQSTVFCFVGCAVTKVIAMYLSQKSFVQSKSTGWPVLCCCCHCCWFVWIADLPLKCFQKPKSYSNYTSTSSTITHR